MSKLIPIQDKVLIRRKATKETTKGGVLLPSIGQHRPNQGVIVRIGAEVKERLGIGENVVFESYVDDIINFEEDGDDLVIISESKIKAVLYD